MNYAIQYHDISGDWLIFNICDSFELVGIHSTEKDAKWHARQLEETYTKRAQWAKDSIYEAA